jgi:hypothetical protein
MNIEFGNFYGSQTIWTIDAKKEGKIELQYDSNVNSGKFKGVLVKPGGEVINIFEGTKKDSTSITVPEGRYRFKIAGNAANGKAAVNLKLDKEMSSTAADK